MLPENLEQLINAPAPGFRCRSVGPGAGGSFVARIHHILRPPASSQALQLIRERLGDYAAHVTEFYSRHNGFVLYCDTQSDDAGFELLPAERWDEATEDMREWFKDLADEPEYDPDRIVTGAAIATVPHSGNYFVMPIEGPNAGKLFYADHDGWYESAFADSFEDMLTRVATDPVHLLNKEFGCYTRYSDGTTPTQWIPEEYHPDVTRAI